MPAGNIPTFVTPRRAGWFLLVAALAASYVEVFHRLNLVDESFAVAIPWRYFLGGRPFIDELNIAQTFALLTYPLLWLHITLVGELDGVLLVFRHVHFLIQIALYVFLYRILSKQFSPLVAFTAPLVVLFFDPADRKTPDYKTLYHGAMTVGLLLAYTSRNKSSWKSTVSGVFLALASAINPGGGLGCALFVVMAWCLKHGGRVKLAAAYLGTVGAMLTCFGIALRLEDIQAIQAYHAERGSNWSTLSMRVIGIFERLLLVNPLKKITILLAGFFLLRAMERHKKLAVLLLFVPLLSVLLGHGKSGQVIYLTFLSAPAFWILRTDNRIRDLFLWVWLPSTICGLFTAILSDTGVSNMAISLLPGLVGSVVALTVCLEATLPRFNRWAPVGVVALTLLSCLSVLDWVEMMKYEDVSSFGSGPYQGIRERREVLALADSLAEDIRQHQDAADGLTMYGGFASGAYLLSTLTPVVPSMQQCAAGSRSCFERLRNFSGKSLVIKWSDEPDTLWQVHYPEGDRIEALLHDRFEKVGQSPYYSIWLEQRVPVTF